MQHVLIEEMLEHIINNVSPKIINEMEDRACWTGISNGKFSVKSAWEYVRSRREEKEVYEFT